MHPIRTTRSSSVVNQSVALCWERGLQEQRTLLGSGKEMTAKAIANENERPYHLQRKRLREEVKSSGEAVLDLMISGLRQDLRMEMGAKAVEGGKHGWRIRERTPYQARIPGS
jgi:hypothetical protein